MFRANLDLASKRTLMHIQMRKISNLQIQIDSWSLERDLEIEGKSYHWVIPQTSLQEITIYQLSKKAQDQNEIYRK
jgi:hypothetical protein